MYEEEDYYDQDEGYGDPGDDEGEYYYAQQEAEEREEQARRDQDNKSWFRVFLAFLFLDFLDR